MMKPAARKVKESTKFPGLTYTLTTGRQAGEFYVEFRHGNAWECYLLADGAAYWVECSDKGRMTAAMLTHCRESAALLAAKTGRKVNGKASGQGWAA